MTQKHQGDEAIAAVPLAKRQHWLVPAVIFGGVEFSLPVIMVGATLVASFGITKIFWMLFVSMILIQWIGNAIMGYIGAKTGRSSSVITRTSFGAQQSRILIGVILVLIFMGWWAVQTAVAANAIAAMLGIDYTQQWIPWAIITIVIGILFSIPSILGYESMKWTDIVAVPAGIILVISGVYLALQNIGLDTILSWSPEEPQLTFFQGVTLIIGANVMQWVYAPDYTRHAKPKIWDNLLIPLGIVAVGFPLVFMGAIMSVGVGDADIVNVMMDLGFPFWGFLILWFSAWTSQLVNNYSMGLGLANIFNMNTNRQRAILTIVGTLISIIIALAGILDYFMDLLNLSAIVVPAIAGVIIVDFFFIRNQQWAYKSGWNWIATISLVIGTIVGYVLQYVVPFGLPAIKSLIISGLIYYIGMKIKAKVAPDQFTDIEEAG